MFTYIHACRSSRQVVIHKRLGPPSTVNSKTAPPTLLPLLFGSNAVQSTEGRIFNLGVTFTARQVHIDALSGKLFFFKLVVPDIASLLILSS